MAIPETTTIGIHICSLCQKDIASGLDAKGFPTACKACRSKSRRNGSPSTLKDIRTKVLAEIGRRGGRARADALTAKQRKEIATKASRQKASSERRRRS